MKRHVALASVTIAAWLFYIGVLTSRSRWTESNLAFDISGIADDILQDTTLFPQSEDPLKDVFNETLGFQNIFVVSLPARSDKRDSFTMQASLSNLSFTIVDGVDGRAVPSQALPYTFDQSHGAIGCWRAHLNILQQMVQRRIRSAVIFEDDADWDVALKYQMTQLARGSRWLTHQPENVTPHSPYGDNWDILWIGHCSTGPDETDNRRWVIPHDPTVVPPDKRWEWEKPDMSPWEDGPDGDNHTRLVYVPDWGSCTAAYAISLSGAKKVLYRQSMLPFNEPVDNGMGSMCREKTFNFSCISVFPTIVGTSTPAGNKDRVSDIHQGESEEEQYDEESHSWRLMFPVRQNIEQLLRGGTTFKSAFPDFTGEQMELSQIGSGVGHAEWLEEVVYEVTVEVDEEQDLDFLDGSQENQINGDRVEIEESSTIIAIPGLEQEAELLNDMSGSSDHELHNDKDLFTHIEKTAMAPLSESI